MGQRGHAADATARHLLSLANQSEGRDGPPTFAKATAGRPGRPLIPVRPATFGKASAASQIQNCPP
jgi:hypothetical protein